ncbi:MAG: RsbRD N-terminal domain-containing protein [Acidobacteriota bacterium]
MTIPNLADLIQAHTRDIVNDWIEAVRNDPRIHSDEDLTDKGIRNHVPFMIEEMCNLLRVGQMPQAANTREGRVHVYTRYRQGYRARDLVCEISLLRIILLDDLAESMLSTQTGGLKTYVEATRIINRYIDEELRYAISVYTEAEQQDQSPGDSKEKQD